MSINVPFVFDSNNESYGTLQNFNSLVNAVNTEFETVVTKDELYSTETVSRTIYVETTGSDETGDGTSVGTAFATIKRALEDIKLDLNNFSIIISCGAGTFDYTLECDQIRNRIERGYIQIIGTLTDILTGISLADTVDPFVYDVSVDGITPSWTTDQYRKFLFESNTTDSFLPIVGNGISSIEITEPSINRTGSKISQHLTTINIEPGKYLEWTDFIKVNLIFSEDTYFYKKNTEPRISYLTQSLLISATPNVIEFHNFLNGLAIRSSFIENCRINFASGLFTVSNSLNYLTSNTISFSYEYGSTGAFYNNIIKSNGLTGYGLSVAEGTNTFGSSLSQITKFYNKFSSLLYVFAYQYTNNIFFGNNISLIIDNVNYFARLTNLNLLNNRTSLIVKGNIIGTPNIRWFYDSAIFNKFYDPPLRNIQIQGILYPELEQNLSSNLLNNTTTSIVIGDVSQNISCKVDYTISRSLGFRSGNFSIITDSSNSYISSDVFVTNANSIVDSSAISFSTDISNGKYIMMNVTQNDYADASLFYNVSRVMKTPLII